MKPADSVSLYEYVKTVKEHPELQDWWFSESAFAGFVKEFQNVSKWTYDGETELLLFKPTVDFRDVLSLKIVSMISDKVIDSASILFEEIFRYADAKLKEGSEPTTAEFSDKHLAKSFWKGIIGTVSSGPTGATRAFEYGKHYATKNIHNSRSPE